MRMDQLFRMIDVVPSDTIGEFQIRLLIDGQPVMQIATETLMKSIANAEARSALRTWIDLAVEEIERERAEKTAVAGVPMRLESNFKNYIGSVYGGAEIDPAQLLDLRRAYFAGCIVSIGYINQAGANENQKEAMKMAREIVNEAYRTGREIAMQAKDRN